MISLKTPAEIDAIGRAGDIIASLFEALPAHVSAGTTTAQIDAFVDGFIRDHDRAIPAFKGLYGFPASACVSVNDEVVHGIPRPSRVLDDADIVSVDVGVRLAGWYADAAVTLPVGDIDPDTARLLRVTEDALWLGIEQARPGNRLGDIGGAVQRHAEDAGFSVVRDLVGHGIGRDPHEEPQVPNVGHPGEGLRLETGMVLCIEPMINAGGPRVRTREDRWTVVTADGRRSAHFEHTIALTEGAPRVLTGARSPATRDSEGGAVGPGASGRGASAGARP